MDYWYEIHGEGAPVVLLHGFTGSSATWENFIQSAPSGIQLITIDLPGHGDTKSDKIKTMATCCNDLNGLFKDLKLSKFFLVGYSMGGRTALSYAATYPETIQGLLLESASPGLADARARKSRKEQDELLAERIETEGVKAFVDYWENIALFASQKELPQSKQNEIREERLRNSAQGLANSLRGMGTGSQVSNWEMLNKLHFPVLLLIGELDSKFITINKKMSELLPNAKIKVVEGAGHAIHVEKPATYGKLITAFINRS